MQETLAAAVILATRWKSGENFINPMCGSGTLAIEAALIAMGKDLGAMRINHGFMHINGFNRPQWRKMKGLSEKTRKAPPGKIIATDIDPRAIEAAQINAAAAGVEHLIDFEVCDFADTQIPEGTGVIVLNPEIRRKNGRGQRTGRRIQENWRLFQTEVYGIPRIHLYGKHGTC